MGKKFIYKKASGSEWRYTVLDENGFVLETGKIDSQQGLNTLIKSYEAKGYEIVDKGKY
jgi:hypothetical protein